MPLFLVVADDVDGENRDLIVSAADAKRALELWRNFMQSELHELYEPGAKIEEVLKDSFNHENVRVFPIAPDDGTEKVQAWNAVLEEAVV